MFEDYMNTKDKILRMISSINKEYKIISNEYTLDNIVKKSIPIRLSKNVKEENRKEYEELIYNYFSPILYKMSDMIDDNIVEWDEPSKIIELKDIIDDNNKIVDLFYEATEKLYIYKKISYNLLCVFVMQIYLFFENEFNNFVIKQYDLKKDLSLTDAINIYAKNLSLIIKPDIIERLNKYRLIINVFKHGKGVSYNSLKKNNPELLNDINGDEDFNFVLNIKYIEIDELISTIEELLDELKK